ncbi:MAG: flagellin [Rhodospirillaceae bacterium]|nr:flagellin [Rhodospirillaceae bacterium]
MAQEITLSTATRTNLLSLQNTTGLIGRTQERLATGLKVNSAIDDALAFFKARNLNARASDLSSVKDGIMGGISVLKAAVQGLESIESVLKQMKALAQSAISAPESTTRAKLASQFNELRSQVDNLAEDSSFSGVNLLKNGSAAFVAGADQMTVKFNERVEPIGVNQLVVSGLNVSDFTSIMAQSATATGAGTEVWGVTGTAAITAITGAIRAIDSALVTVRQSAQQFGTQSSMLQIRADFTVNIINTLKGGAAELVNADLNEESANLLSLQTRQQLGTISLGIAQQSEQSILRLF